MNDPQEIHVSIGEMKKRLSELTNQVAFGGKRVILTSRGRSKAVLVGLDDYELLKHWHSRTSSRREALQKVREHRQAILERRQEPLNIDMVELIHQMREERTDAIIESIQSGG